MILVQFAALVAVCIVIGDNGWDDGSITLAFARTFARHGRVALTSHSEIVEGFSTVSWFLINSLLAIARPSYHAAIFASQLLSVLCICGSTILLARTCALVELDKLFSFVTVLAFAAWGCSFAEASNGMEMGLLAAAFLLVVNELLSTRPRMLLVGVGAALAVTTRFEALAYVGPLALAALLNRQRRAFWVIFVTTLLVVLVLTLCRLVVFSDLLPNTYWAKRWPPYAEFDLLGRLTGAVELLQFFTVPLVVLAFILRSGFPFSNVLRARRQAFLLLVAPVLGAILVGALIGKHWGYKGRMPYFAFAFMLLLVSLTFSTWVRASQTRFRVAVALGACAISLGTSMTGFPSGEIGAALHGGTFGVSPRTYIETAAVLRRFATAADLRQPIVLSPDVGGLALCCDEFRVVDLAFLSNRRLAHRGPMALAEVLERESPTMIQAHWEWAAVGKLYDVPYFQAHYSPAFAGGTKLWIRHDVAERIERNRRGCWVPTARHDLRDVLVKHRYANHDTPEDREAFERPGAVLVLNESDADVAIRCD